MFLADLHIHSTFSDGKLTIPEIVDLYGEKGFGAIAITDHICETNTFWGRCAHHLQFTLTRATFPLYQAVLASEAKRAWEMYRMVVIPGMEITKNAFADSRSAHILALGVKEWISADTPVAEVLKKIRALNGLSVAAHPLTIPHAKKQTHYLWNHRERYAPYVDAWEVANGRVFFEPVYQTSLIKLATSDLHVREDFESWKTQLHCERHPEAIFDAIRRQKLSFPYVKESIIDDDVALPIGRNLDEFAIPHPARHRTHLTAVP